MKVEFARDRSNSILDFCITAIQEHGQSMEDCLASYPEERYDLEPLLRLVARLQVTQSVRASPQFKTAAENRLRKLAQAGSRPALPVSLPTKRLQRKGNPLFLKAQPRWRLLTASLLLAVLIISSIGTVAASAQALPGDFLYPVKRTQESIQMTFTPGTAGQAQLHLEFANRRLDEALTLLDENRPMALGTVLAEYNDQMQTELTYLDQKSGLTPTEQSGLANSLISDVSSHQARLASLTKAAPQSVQGNIQIALSTSKQAYNRAAEIVQTKKNNQAHPAATPTPTPSSTPPPPSQTQGPTLVPHSQTPLPTLPAARIFPFFSVPIHTPTPIPGATQPKMNATLLSKLTLTSLPRTTVRSSAPRRSPQPTPTPRPTPRPWAVPLLKTPSVTSGR